MKTLLTFFLCLLAVCSQAANPSTKSFRATGGLLVTSNDATGIITYDGSGIAGPTNGATLTQVTNIARAFSDDKQYGALTLTNLSAQYTNILLLNTSSNLTVALSNVPNNTLVRLAPGTYDLACSMPSSNQLSAINVFSKSNIRIQGAGMGITTLNGTNLGSLFQFTNVNGLTIQDITLRGTMLTNYTQYTNCYGWAGLEVFDCQNVLMDHVGFVDHFDHALIDSGGAYGIAGGLGPYSTNNFKVSNCYFDNIGSWRTNCAPLEQDGTACPGGGWTTEYCYFVNCMRAFEPYAIGSQLLTDTIVRGNIIRNCIEHALTSAGTTNNVRLIVEDNLFIWDKGYQRRGTNPLPATAIYITGGQRNIIRGNRIVNVPNTGIQFAGTTDQFGSIIENNFISGQLYGVGGGPGASPLYDYGIGISFYNGDLGVYNFREVTIKNNRFQALGGSGLILAVMRDSEVVGNTFVNCGTNAYNALQVYTTSGHVVSNVVLSGNTIITDSTAAGPTVTGIDINAHVRQLALSGNVVSGTTTPIANAAGSETIMLNQINYTTGNMQNDKTNVFSALRLAGQGTNVLLQLSANSNVTAVTIGSGLTMTAGTLASTGGGSGASTNQVLTNLVGTAANNVTNVVSLSTSNATSKPITNSYTAGTLTLFGLEAGANTSITPNGSNLVVAMTGAGGGNFSTNAAGFGQFYSGIQLNNLNADGVLLSLKENLAPNSNVIQLLDWSGVVETFAIETGGVIVSPQVPRNAGAGAANMLVANNESTPGSGNSNSRTNKTFIGTNGIVIHHSANLIVASNSLPASGVTNLNDLYDVGIGTLHDFDALFWIASMGIWTNYSPFFQINFNITNVNLTNIIVGVQPEQLQTITTNASFRFFLTGTPMNGEIVKYAISNYSASVIFATNTTGIYDVNVASNVTTFAVAGNSIRWLEFISLTNMSLGVQRWEMRQAMGKEVELAVAGSLTIHTNTANSIITLSNSTASAAGGITNVQFGLTVDGAGSVVTTGQKGYYRVPFNMTITGWEIVADQSGSCVVDVWRTNYANFPPTVAATIAASAKPTLSSAVKNQDVTLTGWTTSVTKGDYIGWNVDSASTVTRAQVFIYGTSP